MSALGSFRNLAERGTGEDSESDVSSVLSFVPSGQRAATRSGDVMGNIGEITVPEGVNAD